MYYTRFNTPFCDVILAGDSAGLAHLHLNTGEGNRKFEIQPHWEENPDFFDLARVQILEYLDGNRRSFDIPIAPGARNSNTGSGRNSKKSPMANW